MESYNLPTIRDLYPQLDNEHLKEAEENLERYIELALRIYERARMDPEAQSDLRNLTGSRHDPTMEDKRSNPSFFKSQK